MGGLENTERAERALALSVAQDRESTVSNQ